MGRKGTTGGFAFSLDLPTGTMGLLQTGVHGNRAAQLWGEERELGVRRLEFEMTVVQGAASRRRLCVMRSSLGVGATDSPWEHSGQP